MYLFLPWLIAAVLVIAWRTSVRRYALRLAVIAGCAALINAPQYARNLDLSGSVLGFDSAQALGRNLSSLLRIEYAAGESGETNRSVDAHIVRGDGGARWIRCSTNEVHDQDGTVMLLPDKENKLHDGAVIIKNLRIAQAGAVLPLTGNAPITA